LGKKERENEGRRKGARSPFDGSEKEGEEGCAVVPCRTAGGGRQRYELSQFAVEKRGKSPKKLKRGMVMSIQKISSIILGRGTEKKNLKPVLSLKGRLVRREMGKTIKGKRRVSISNGKIRKGLSSLLLNWKRSASLGLRKEGESDALGEKRRSLSLVQQGGGRKKKGLPKGLFPLTRRGGVSSLNLETLRKYGYKKGRGKAAGRKKKKKKKKKNGRKGVKHKSFSARTRNPIHQTGKGGGKKVLFSTGKRKGRNQSVSPEAAGGWTTCSGKMPHGDRLEKKGKKKKEGKSVSVEIKGDLYRGRKGGEVQIPRKKKWPERTGKGGCVGPESAMKMCGKNRLNIVF